MPNPDLISMALVCRDWHQTCVRHLSAQLNLNMWGTFHDECQHYLDSFHGRGHHPNVPKHPHHVKSIDIMLDLTTVTETTVGADFDAMYVLLDCLRHVRRLEVYAFLSVDQLGVLGMLYRDVCARLPNIKHLKLSWDWVIGVSDDWSSVELYQAILERMIGSYQLTNLALLAANLSDGATILNGQVSTLTELHIPLCLVANPTSGFLVACFPRVKRLKLRSLDVSEDAQDAPTGDGQVLQFGATFPTLDYLYMDTADLSEYGGEELGNALQIANTNPCLKHLTLVTSPRFKVLPGALSITFDHLETLMLLSDGFGEEHLQLVASMQWPALKSLSYWCDGVYPSVVPHLLAQAPKLKWFVAAITSDPDFFPGLAEMFGQTEWPNLQGVCIANANWDKEDTPPGQVPTVQKACPNATIHVTLKKGDELDSRLFYGVDLSPQCNRECYKCIRKSIRTY
jgi:hypothetical protein